MPNKELRRLARANDVPQWKIAQQLGVTEMTLYRWMRVELAPDKAEKVRQAIEALTNEQEELQCV